MQDDAVPEKSPVTRVNRAQKVQHAYVRAVQKARLVKDMRSKNVE